VGASGSAGHYWSDRHRHALAKAEQARDHGLREIYIELADHYLTMEQLVMEAEERAAARSLLASERRQ
jgi:predicted protein tyrosine phosphatase